MLRTDQVEGGANILSYHLPLALLNEKAGTCLEIGGKSTDLVKVVTSVADLVGGSCRYDAW